MITYQRNIGRLLSQKDVADEGLEELVGCVEIHADGHARDDDDDGALGHLLPAGPLDLLQLRPRLPDEARLARGLPRPVWADFGCAVGRTCSCRCAGSA